MAKESFEARMRRARAQRMCQLMTMALQVRKAHEGAIREITMKTDGMTYIVIWLEEGGYVQVIGPDAFDLVHPGLVPGYNEWEGSAYKSGTEKKIDNIVMKTQEEAMEFIEDMIKWLSK